MPSLNHFYNLEAYVFKYDPPTMDIRINLHKVSPERLHLPAIFIKVLCRSLEVCARQILTDLWWLWYRVEFATDAYHVLEDARRWEPGDLAGLFLYHAIHYK